MPDHIQNRIRLFGDTNEVQKLLSHIKGQSDTGEEIRIDFNTITPRPEGLQISHHLGVIMWAKLCTGQLDFASLLSPTDRSTVEMFSDQDYKGVSNKIEAQTALECLLGKRNENIKEFNEEEFNGFIQCLKNYRSTGYMTWYDWSLDNWGTKWNAYNQQDERNTIDTIFFQTAWNSPILLIRKLSGMFPFVTIELTFADESGGYTGRLKFHGGEFIEINQPGRRSKEAYEICFELHPESINYYKLVGDTYEYVEE